MHDSTNGYAGVDWATDAHAVCVVGENGQVIVEFDVAHTADGLAELCRQVNKAGAKRVAIERPDGPVRFLERFPSATRAGWLSEKRLGAWLRANGYSGRRTPAELQARLAAAPAGIGGD